MLTAAVKAKKTIQTLRCGDARELSWIPDESVHLVVTSPPYWTLKEYPAHKSQLGLVSDYEKFHDELDKVWRHCLRVLVPGGRLVCVVGDVCLSRKRHGRHMVMPLHADIVVRCRRIGFDNLTPILWYKISNAAYEVENGSSFLGKPYEPNAIIKNDVEFILMLRKPGGYRQPTEEQRDASRLTKEEHHDWFQQIWTLPGESTRQHPAPYPLSLPIVWCGCFLLREIPCWTHSWGPGRLFWPPHVAGVTVSGLKLMSPISRKQRLVSNLTHKSCYPKPAHSLATAGLLRAKTAVGICC